MKKKKFWLSLCLLICLLFALPSAASAAKAQWKVENGKFVYYGTNGKKYVGGPKKIGKSLYLFNSKGELIQNQLTLYKKKLYLSGAKGALLTKRAKVGGQYYYGTSKGYLKTGLQTYKKNYYYHDPTTGRMVKNTWKKVGKYTYYFTSGGSAAKGKIYTIDKFKYYFDKNARLVKKVTKVGKYYYGFGPKTGKMQFGWVKLGKYKYYFSPSTGRASTGWKTISGKKYHFTNYGALQTGWITIGTKRYYLDPKANGAQVFGKKKIDGKTYNFGKKGYISFSASSYKRVEVNRKKNVVTVYENGVPIKAMTCSTGAPGMRTPTGTFVVQSHLAWHMLNGPSMGQYCSHFLPDYLFHSVPAYGTSRNPYGVNASDFNRLGNAASGGCVRLTVADAKWIYYNVPIGSTVVISDSAATPLGKPSVPKMPSGTKGADPTDDFRNPEGYN